MTYLQARQASALTTDSWTRQDVYAILTALPAASDSMACKFFLGLDG
jgi:hypothetical protein